MNLIRTALQFVATAYADESRHGAAVVVKSGKLDRVGLLGELAQQFMKGGYDPDTEEPPRLVLSVMQELHLVQIQPRVSTITGLSGEFLAQTRNPRPRIITPITYTTHQTLYAHRAKLSAKEFDFVILDIRAAGELTRCIQYLSWLDPLFTLLVVSKNSAAELSQWPQCGIPLLLGGEAQSAVGT